MELCCFSVTYYRYEAQGILPWAISILDLVTHKRNRNLLYLQAAIAGVGTGGIWRGHLCEECPNMETLRFQNCGTRIWTDGNMGDEDTPLCGRTILRDDAYYDVGGDSHGPLGIRHSIRGNVAEL